jgi:peptide methionine sulfoxide reductase MsrB
MCQFTLKNPLDCTELGDGIIEMYYHRCKSHIGNVVEEHNKTLYGEFYECHRVNGQSLKYVFDDLPKQIVKDARLSVMDNTKARLRY